MVTVVTRLPCTKDSAPDRSAHTSDILGRSIVYFCSDFISDSSGTAIEGKLLRLNAVINAVRCKNESIRLQTCFIANLNLSECVLFNNLVRIYADGVKHVKKIKINVFYRVWSLFKCELCSNGVICNKNASKSVSW